MKSKKKNEFAFELKIRSQIHLSTWLHRIEILLTLVGLAFHLFALAHR